MQEEVPARKRVVEVIADLGAGQSPRWRYGSGLLVGGGQVLTCAHVVVGAVDVVVRRPDKSSMSAALDTALIGTPDPRGLDLALLEIPDTEDLPYVPIGLVNRDVAIGESIDGCAAVGYPAFQEVERDSDGLSIRETVQVRGSVEPLSGMVENLLSLNVTKSPRELPPAAMTLGQSPWSGMSGAAVLAPDGRATSGQLLLGVVAEHSPRRGQSDITVLPLDRLIDAASAPANASSWWARLGVMEPGGLPRVPSGTRLRTSRLYNVPQLPAHFVARPEAASEVKELLCTGSNHMVGLHGMGGAGKSVIAAIVARDEEVQRAFGDGVIWITVGPGADAATLLRLQQQLAEALNDTGPPLTDVEQGAARLSELFHDKAGLLILDDIWRFKDLEAFGSPGGRCRVLITTRERSVLVNIGAAEVRLDVLTREQSLALLGEWVTQPSGSLPSAASDVAEECGNLPLALAMVGAMIRGKPNRWANVLHKLRSQDLEQIGRDFPRYPYPNLFRTIQASVEALESAALRDRYVDFSVFDRNVAVPLTVLESFWKPLGMDEFDVEDAVDALVDASLIQRTGDGRLRLHDLQLDYVIKQAGDRLALHNRLLAAYDASVTPDWSSVPDDGYFLENLSYHLVQAGRADELHHLLQHQNDAGTNTWHARLSSVNPSGALFIRDVTRAWSAAAAVNAAAAEQQQPCPLIGLEVLYALATSSVRSLSSNIPQTLFAPLLENRVWTKDQAVAAARQAAGLPRQVDGLAAVAASSPLPERIALYREALTVVSSGIGSTENWIPKEALCRLIPLLPGDLLPEAVAVARTLPDMANRAEVLLRLGRDLPEPVRKATLSEAVTAARAVRDGFERVDALLGIVDNLPEPLRDDILRETLAIARSLDPEESWRARALADLAGHLAEPVRLKVLGEALEAVRAVPQEPVDPTSSHHWTQERTAALSEIAPKLPPALLDEAVAIAYGLPSQWDRDIAFEALVPRLAESGRLDQALTIFRAMRGRDRADALAEAADRLSSVADLRAVLSATRDADRAVDSYGLARVQKALAVRLARLGLHAEANSVARTVDDPLVRLEMCVELAEILPLDLRDRAIDDALAAAQSDRVQRFLEQVFREMSDEPIMRLAVRLADDGRFDRALGAARTFPQRVFHGGASQRAAALGLLAAHLPDEVRRGVLLEALAAAQLIGDVYPQAYALAAWTAAWPVDTADRPDHVTGAFRRVLTVLSAVSEEEQRLQPFILLVPLVPESMLHTSLEVARTFRRAERRAVALTRTAVRLPPADRAPVLAEALEGVKVFMGPHRLVPLLAQVLPEFSADQQRYVLKMVMQRDVYQQRMVLPVICAALPDDLRREALPGIASLADVTARRDSLIQLASVLSEAEQSTLLADLASLEDAVKAGRALAVLSANLAEGLLPPAIAVAQDLPDPVGRAVACSGLALRLAAVNSLDQAWELAGQIDWELNNGDLNVWAPTITALAEFFPPGTQPMVEPATLAAALAIGRGWVRAQVISTLSPFLDPPAAAELFRTEIDKLHGEGSADERSKMLMAMAPRLPEQLLPAAMAAACTIADSGYLYLSPRAVAMAALSKRLSVLPKAVQYRIWRDAVRLLAGRARSDLLWDLGALAPLARELGGEDAPAVAIGMLEQIVRWWP